MHIDIAVNQLKFLVSFYENYRENGFMFVIVLAKIIVSVELEPKLHEIKKDNENISKERILFMKTF